MPKDTFYNLNENKKIKIKKALVNEFSRVPFEKASINNVIKEANIPRGSFYQYFEDKEDAIKYVVQRYIELEHKTTYDMLKRNDGDIFETSVDIFEYIIKKALNNPEFRLYKNILEQIRKSNINIFDEEEKYKEKESLYKLINKEILNLSNKEEIKYFMKILTSITISTSMEVISKKVTIEEGRKSFLKQIDILKKGMFKKIK